jgi:uncharacterized SAM-binding protein YcdF (DUF218 family)
LDFILSKVLWWVTSPAALLLAAAGIGMVLLWTPFRRLARWLVTLAILPMILCALFPVGLWITNGLENRFPFPSSMPDKVDGIIVLGGSINQFVSRERNQPALSGSAERLISGADLARRYPAAKLIFTGGSGALRQDVKEAEVAAQVWAQMGLPVERALYEDASRNTWENAVFSRQMADPKPGETWLLVTSAWHMPRAVGCFRQTGWNVIPYPVDYETGALDLSLRFDPGGVGRLAAALHEWVGMIGYRLMGRTDAFYPGPAGGGVS